MYGLPVNFDLSFFRGRTLLQICVAAHDLMLNFDGRVSITITSHIECSVSKGHPNRYEDFRRAAGTVAMFVGQVVSVAEGDAEGTLVLEFQEGGRIRIYDDTKQYESYTIRNGDQLTVV